MLSAWCSYLLSGHSCLIRLSTGPRDLCWGAGPAREAGWLAGCEVFPEWAPISYFNTGDTTFFFFLIVSVSLTNTLPSALLRLFLAPDHLGDSFPVKTKYSKIHLNKITQSKVLNFLFLERKTTNPKTYFEVNEFLFFLFFKAVFKKSNSSYDFPIALLK